MEELIESWLRPAYLDKLYLQSISLWSISFTAKLKVETFKSEIIVSFPIDLIFIDRCLLESVIADSHKLTYLWLLFYVPVMRKGNLPFIAWKGESLSLCLQRLPTI